MRLMLAISDPESAIIQQKISYIKDQWQHDFFISLQNSCLHHRPKNRGKSADLYKFVMKEVERPLLREVMKYSKSNQTEASKILGINRTTLRKKLKDYKII